MFEIIGARDLPLREMLSLDKRLEILGCLVASSLFWCAGSWNLTFQKTLRNPSKDVNQSSRIEGWSRRVQGRVHGESQQEDPTVETDPQVRKLGRGLLQILFLLGRALGEDVHVLPRTRDLSNFEVQVLGLDCLSGSA